MKIGVIMGGISSEREISLKSGEQVLLNLNRDKYEEIIPIIIDSKSEVVEKVKGIDFAFLTLFYMDSLENMELFKGYLKLWEYRIVVVRCYQVLYV